MKGRGQGIARIAGHSMLEGLHNNNLVLAIPISGRSSPIVYVVSLKLKTHFLSVFNDFCKMGLLVGRVYRPSAIAHSHSPVR